MIVLQSHLCFLDWDLRGGFFGGSFDLGFSLVMVFLVAEEREIGVRRRAMPTTEDWALRSSK